MQCRGIEVLETHEFVIYSFTEKFMQSESPSGIEIRASIIEQEFSHQVCVDYANKLGVSQRHYTFYALKRTIILTRLMLPFKYQILLNRDT